MKFGVVVAGTIAILGMSGLALAQTPPARTGFQMHIRTGYSLPMGNFQQGAAMSDMLSGQVPFILDIGGKITPEFFLGGYLGLGFGGMGGAAKRECEADQLECRAVGVHIGIEAQYHILPAGLVNPWVGYGLGYESVAVSQGRNGVTTSASVGGFEFARFMAGADFRVTRGFGVGPFMDLSMATYSRVSNSSFSANLEKTATHEWLTLGVRFVVFP